MANPHGHEPHAWLKGHTVSEAKIIAGLEKVRQIKISSAKNLSKGLKNKQQLVRDLIVTFVEKSIQFERGQLPVRPKPLRLILGGDPGAGKSHTIR